MISYHVIEKILKEWEDLHAVKEDLDKFSTRYPDDVEFQKLYTKFKEYLTTETDKLEKIKSELKRLERIRKIESSGGMRLPFRDRRRLGGD